MSSALTLCTLGIAISSGLPRDGLIFDFDSTNYNYSAGTWIDTSGNNNHATQSTSGKRPTIISDALNGFSGIRFDGSDDCLILPTGLTTAHHFWVFKSITANFNNYGSVVANIDGALRSGTHFQFGSTQFHADPLPVAVRKNKVDLSGSFSLTTITSYMLLSVQPFRTTVSLQIGAMETFFGNLEIVKAAAYNTVQAGTALTQIENYLISRYGLS